MAIQHYVPKFYFKMFTGLSNCINLLLTKDSKVINNASIRGQCSNNRFYGSDKIEQIFSQLESMHCDSLKWLIDSVWQSISSTLDPKHHVWILNAILFQRSRTELEIKKIAPALEYLSFEYFKEYLKHNSDDRFYAKFTKAVENGEVSIKSLPQYTVFNLIAIGIQPPILITDLSFHVLRNFSDYPFIFSDAPVVFCNTFYQHIRNRGVFGLQSPGLQIFYPLNSYTMIMLSDDQVYYGNRLKSTIIDIFERSDVSQLNALQLHHSLNAVYFANPEDEDYITSLWSVHKDHIIKPKAKYGIEDGWLINGKPPNGILYHTFEPHLNFILDLSFIECTPVEQKDYKFSYRCPDIAEEYSKEIMKNIKKKPDVKQR